MKATDRICNDIAIAGLNFARHAFHPLASEASIAANAGYAREMADRIIAIRTLGEQCLIYVADCIRYERGQVCAGPDQRTPREIA